MLQFVDQYPLVVLYIVSFIICLLELVYIITIRKNGNLARLLTLVFYYFIPFMNSVLAVFFILNTIKFLTKDKYDIIRYSLNFDIDDLSFKEIRDVIKLRYKYIKISKAKHDT